MSKHYLLKFSDNWADEMDLDGHKVLTQKEYDRFTKAAAKVTTMTMSVGTNEEIEYGGKYGSPISSAYSIVELTDDQARVLRELDLEELGFADRFYWNVIEEVYDPADDDDDEDDDEEDEEEEEE